jgi:hypothetical protein
MQQLIKELEQDHYAMVDLQQLETLTIFLQ